MAPVEDDGWRSTTEITDEEDEQRELDFRSQIDELEVHESPNISQSIEDEEEEKYPQFDPDWIREFIGLAYIGYLEDEVRIPYHRFTVRTLKTGEKIKVTSMIKHLEDSIGYARAYRAAVVAAGLEFVDGEKLLVGSKKTDAIAQKYQYIIDNWHDFVIDLLYDKINELEGQVVNILRDLGIYEDTRQVATVETATTAGEPEKD